MSAVERQGSVRMGKRVPAAARWWHRRADGRIECELCPRACKLQDGQHGFCLVRERHGDRLELTAYGRTSGFCVDPIEKKPLYHFLPGSSVLSFGTVGCNLGCSFCQNWRLTRARDLSSLLDAPSPDAIAAAAHRLGCRSVAFTYNDPVTFAEYALDVAQACHAAGIRTVAVSAGFISVEPRKEFFSAIDAANIDLKAFTPEFYRRTCHGDLSTVLETLVYVRQHTPVWLEVTTLLIPGMNDSEAEITRAANWFVRELGPEVPWHFTAYHPAWKLQLSPTPPSTIARARDIARSCGVKFVYTGNLSDPAGENTWCPACGGLLLERGGYEIGRRYLNGNRCGWCDDEIPGEFEENLSETNSSAPLAWKGEPS
jgi:pyruvate formate lyase activating enzyme